MIEFKKDTNYYCNYCVICETRLQVFPYGLSSQAKYCQFCSNKNVGYYIRFDMINGSFNLNFVKLCKNKVIVTSSYKDNKTYIRQQNLGYSFKEIMTIDHFTKFQDLIELTDKIIDKYLILF